MNAVDTTTRAVRGAEALNILLGVWLAVSPFVLGFRQDIAAMWNNIAVGIALVLVEVAAEWAGDALQALVVPLGAWLFASSFVLGFPNAAFLANNLSVLFVAITVGAIRDGLRPATRVTNFDSVV